MDCKKIIDINEIKKTLTRLENIAALSLVLFFFFPWVSLGPFGSMSGFGAAGENLLLLLVPVLALLIVAMRPICQIPMVLKSMKLVLGGLIILGFIIVIIKGAFSFLGLGAFLTVIAGVLIILGTLDKVQLPNALPALDACETETTEEETEES